MPTFKNIVVNPYLPSYEYIPDGEPRVFNGRLYLYGSHDRFDGDFFCENDYVCWSAPTDDLSDWRFDGVIYKKEQDPFNIPGESHMFAPDVVKGPDGRYYLFYGMDFVNRVTVAVADRPEGPFERLGEVRYPDGVRFGGRENEPLRFDPGVLVDDDGRVYLYTGFSIRAPWFERLAARTGLPYIANGSTVTELEKDMLTVKTPPKPLLPGVDNAAGTGFEGHAFFEASSMRKFDGRYYAVYSSQLSHELAYATSDRPDGGFVYGGTLHSNAWILRDGDAPKNFWGNNHGSLAKIDGKFYIFGHRQTNAHEYSRQGVAEEIIFKDGKFLPAEMTSQGLYGRPLPTGQTYEAGIACGLYGKDGPKMIAECDKDRDPYITQEGEDREERPRQYIAGIRDGTVICYRYFDFKGEYRVTLEYSGEAKGKMRFSHSAHGEIIGEAEITPGEHTVTERIYARPGVRPLYLRFKGTGRLSLYTLKVEPIKKTWYFIKNLP